MVFIIRAKKQLWASSLCFKLKRGPYKNPKVKSPVTLRLVSSVIIS